MMDFAIKVGAWACIGWFALVLVLGVIDVAFRL